MEGGDVTLVWFDSLTRKAEIADYILTAKSQCAPQSKSGACPDKYFGGTEDSQLVSWSYVNGILRATYRFEWSFVRAFSLFLTFAHFRRPLDTGDDSDSKIVEDYPIVLIAAIGQLNNRREAAYHTIDVTRHTVSLTFNRPNAENNCRPLNAGMSESIHMNVWRQARFSADTTEFKVLIGPAGGDRGYTGITGLQSWGIAFWINNEVIN